MSRPALNSGELVWSGEHWINVIKPPGAEAPSARFSLYHTRYSEAGEGNTLHLVIPAAGINLVCTDNPRVGEWINSRFLKMGTVPSPDAPIVKADFQRQGSTHDSPRWVVETEGHRIVAGWSVKEPPVIAYGPLSEGFEFFTLLLFSDETTVELDGSPIPGTPFVIDAWRDSIGGDRSSCVFALAETMIQSDARE